MNGEFVMPSSLYTLSAYEDVTPLCEKGHVMLVRNVYNGNLYVKKQIQCYDPEIYFQLKKYHIKHIPEIYEIFEGESSQESDGTNVVIIEEYFTGSTIAECLMEKGFFRKKMH